MAMVFCLLGPLALGGRGWREPHTVHAPKLRCVLATLLLEANEVVSLDRLSMEVWGQEPPRSAIANLRSYAHALRGEFVQAGLAPDRLVSVPGGYLLKVESGERDLDAWHDLVVKARADRDRGYFQEAASLYDRALGLWRGRALQEVPAGPLSAAHATSLDEQRLTVMEEQAEVLVAAGAVNLAVPRLRRYLDEHPTRERAYALLMRALFHAGDASAALKVYARAREALDADLGVAPGTELNELRAAILRRTLPVDEVPARNAVPVPRQLPPKPAVLVGRDREFAELRNSNAAIKTIQGPAGVGKSALAVWLAHEVAERYPDGQLYLDLRGSNSRLPPVTPLEILSRFLRAFGVADNQVPKDLGEATARYRDLLADRRVLVVLDNAVDVNQFEPLLNGTQTSDVIVTSRYDLTIPGEAHKLELRLLTSEHAIDLLAGFAARRIPQDRDSMGRLAELCGRLPLALRIAAARLITRPDWAPAQLADRLADERHRLDELNFDDLAIKVCFQASYRLLDSSSAMVFRLAGLLRVPKISTAVVAAMLGGSCAESSAVLGRLVAVHLLDPVAPDLYQMHDLLRLYAAERALAEDRAVEREAALHRAFSYYLGTSRRAVLLLYGLDRPIDQAFDSPEGRALTQMTSQADALHWLDVEFESALAVADQATEALAVDTRYPGQLLRASTHHLVRRGDWIELERLGRLAHRIRQPDDATSEAIGIGILGQVEARAGRFVEANRLLRRAAQQWQKTGDVDGQAATWNVAGVVARQAGDLQGALACLKKSLEAARKIGNSSAESLILTNMSEVYAELGMPAAAITCLRQSLRLGRPHMSRLRDGIALGQLGRHYAQLNDGRRAISYLSRSLRICNELEDSVGTGQALLCRSEVLVRLGRPSNGLADARRAHEIYSSIGDQYGQAATLRQMAKAWLAKGVEREATRCLSQARLLFGSPTLLYLRAMEDFLAGGDPELPHPR